MTVPISAETPSGSRPAIRKRPPLASIVIVIVVACVVAAGTWYMGSQQDWELIGQGGINRQLLPKVGDVAPDLVALDRDGKPVFLSQFQGQPVWLNFWGSWCPPCRAEMPEMQKAYEQLAPQGLVLLAVSLDEPVAAAVEYAELNGATYTVVGDPQREGSAAYPIFNFPTHILIDREGIVRDIVLAELNAEQFIAHAQIILKPVATE